MHNAKELPKVDEVKKESKIIEQLRREVLCPDNLAKVKYRKDWDNHVNHWKDKP